jgi:hypothetical protein
MIPCENYGDKYVGRIIPEKENKNKYGEYFRQ